MSPELENLLRDIIHLIYDYSRETEDKSYLGLADEISAIILEMRDGGY
jgi:hypothetical protein